MSRTPIWARMAAGAITVFGILANPARAADTRAWRLLSESAAFPPMLAVPMGVYDPVRHRVLAIDTDYSEGPLVVHVFERTLEPHWSRLAASDAPPKHPYLASLVYDPVRDRLLVLGGFGFQLHDFEVWALNLSGAPAWQRLATNGIPPVTRGGHSAIYDPINDRVIVFGGAASAAPAVGWIYLSDVWAFSLSSDTWSALTPSGPTPGGREGHGALYDPEGQRMIVFGGHFENGMRGFWNDLWELSLGDTLAWSEIQATGPIPGARSAFGTVLDPVRHRMLIHGGVNDQSGIEPDNLWALSLSGPPAWTEIATEDTLRGRSYPIDVYDPVGDRLLACGGGSYPQTSELSLSDPVRWNAVLPPRPLPTPSARAGHAVVHDTRRDRFLVIGGAYSTVDSAMWSFDPEASNHWLAVNAPPAPGDPWGFGLSQSAVYDSLGDRIIICDGVQAWSSPAEEPREWTPLGFPFQSEPMTAGSGAGVALDSRRNRLIVSGGWIPYPHSAGFALVAIRSLSLGSDPTWSIIGNLPQPLGAVGPATFYDPIRDQLVVMGGWGLDGRFSIRRYYGAAVWATPLDSALHWTTLTSVNGTIPGALPDARVAFDPRLDGLFVFVDSTVWSRQVDDTGPWTLHELSTPRPTVTSPVVYDPVRAQVLALFGSAAGSAPVQAWAVALGPLSVSLLESSRSPEAVELKWRSYTAIGHAATIGRREVPSDWLELGPISFDAQGLATFSDHGVRAGHDYGYRVSVVDGDSTWHSDAILVTQPGSLRLVLLGARPNPAVGSIQLAFSLPAAGPARLELFDLRGRRCMSREVGALGTGKHWLTIGESASLKPGVYFARLQRGREVRSTRVVLMR